jgi:hypothetical protein
VSPCKPGVEVFRRRGIEEKRKKVQAVPDNIPGRGDGRAWCPAYGPEASWSLAPGPDPANILYRRIYAKLREQ